MLHGFCFAADWKRSAFTALYCLKLNIASRIRVRRQIKLGDSSTFHTTNDRQTIMQWPDDQYVNSEIQTANGSRADASRFL